MDVYKQANNELESQFLFYAIPSQRDFVLLAERQINAKLEWNHLFWEALFFHNFAIFNGLLQGNYGAIRTRTHVRTKIRTPSYFFQTTQECVTV